MLIFTRYILQTCTNMINQYFDIPVCTSFMCALIYNYNRQTKATMSVTLYARKMQLTWDHIHYLEVSYRECQNIKVYILINLIE